MGCNRAPRKSERRCNLAYSFIAGLILLSACVTTSTVPEMAWVRTDGRRSPMIRHYCSRGRAILLLAMQISIAERQPHRRAGAWPNRGMCLSEEIKQRTCVQHVLPVRNAALPTDNDSWRSVIASEDPASSRRQPCGQELAADGD
jgi:hypothetical protein